MDCVARACPRPRSPAASPRRSSRYGLPTTPWAGRVAVMDLGRIKQVGTPHEVYEQPRSRFVADFIGIANILPCDDGRWLALRPEKIVLYLSPPDTAQSVA